MLRFKLIAVLLLITLTFFATSTVVAAEISSEWSKPYIEAAKSMQLKISNTDTNFKLLLTRGELAELAIAIYEAAGSEVEITKEDIEELKELYGDKNLSEGILKAIKFKIMSSTNTYKENDSDLLFFAPEQHVTREQATLVLYNIYKNFDKDNDRKANPTISFKDKNKISPWALEAVTEMTGKGIVNGSNNLFNPKVYCKREDIYVMVIKLFESIKGIQLVKLSSPPETIAEVDTKTVFNENDLKKSLSSLSFASNDQALLSMTRITFSVWKVDGNGNKITGSQSILVHKDVAPDVLKIFDEIYKGSEKFPIKAVSGYSWRGAGSKSSHNIGLAIDINPDENYFISSSGDIRAGKFWKPAENQYSIKENGDVVKAFSKYGWYWGGIGWNTGKDYMHFSLTGI